VVVDARSRGDIAVEPEPRPLVLAVTEPVTRATAPMLVSRVERIAANHKIVIDLTAIPEFDTDGTSALLELQASLGAGQLTIIGLRQATARLVGSMDEPVVTARHDQRLAPWVMHRLRAIAVVQPSDTRPATSDELEPALNVALDAELAIVVVDLRGVRLTRRGLQAIAFASSTAALRGQELLVANADEHAAERLRRAGLSATTYVAPAPLPET